ncbi:acetyl-CoA carboxylase biotin carboxylase subunit [Candidatus Woesearchaeota archaeon]|nr:acetyl-CoA carboxylase biotin carboxylase subunit [Candidatus Woesearchaeota archaeon]
MLADKKSKSFINALVKAFGASREQEKDYTVLEREKLFNRILIANRGEIALRVIRACRELGVEVVTVYTEQDKDALTVKMSDKAYYIGDTPLAYLDMAKIIATAKKAKADAIHPGYGFLAENADFADMCEKNKIKFIGPSSKTIKALGDKVQAKNISRKANVPIIIGTRTLKDAKEAGKEAEKIGYPVILKASAGGGGKGMRVVRSEKEIEKSLTAAQNEALASFKDKSVYMEKYVEDPRHIEFQILADKSGNVIHLGERDCSIQRRHQKLVEESPSPALNEELREKMGSAAVRAVSSVKYLGAGTVEFLLDADGKFYFIEVNTRIQVEHGVTEMVTGVDLVKEQIKLTAGAKLAFSQSDIELDGHAIECRINAEDPTEDFAPSVGTISNYLPPGGPGIRVNSICHTGYRVSADYDSLLSLLITHAPTREEAILRMERALNEYEIAGVDTTIPFHLCVLHNETFRKGNITTSFIEKEKIAEHVRKICGPKMKKITKEEKMIIVTSAVGRHLERKRKRREANAWSMEARREAIEGERF